MKITAQQLLNKAATIQDQRGKQYDTPDGERSMGKVVAMFNTVKGSEVLTESDGWLIQTMLKIVRGEANGPHEDSCLDLVSYASLYGETRLGDVSKPLVDGGAVKQDGEWIVWNGGECPTKEKAIVDYKLRSGELYNASPVCRLDWSHDGVAFDIIAYRVVK